MLRPSWSELPERSSECPMTNIRTILLHLKEKQTREQYYTHRFRSKRLKRLWNCWSFSPEMRSFMTSPRMEGMKFFSVKTWNFSSHKILRITFNKETINESMRNETHRGLLQNINIYHIASDNLIGLNEGLNDITEKNNSILMLHGHSQLLVSDA